MATRKAQAVPLQAKLSADQMQRGIGRLERLIEDLRAFDVTTITKRLGPEARALEVRIQGTIDSVFGHGTVEQKRYSSGLPLHQGPVHAEMPDWIGERSGYSSRDDLADAIQYVDEGRNRVVQLLFEAVDWLRDELRDAAPLSPQVEAPATELKRSIFIVHGHDNGTREAVARFVERIGFEAIVLSEQANQGRTIIEKIEAHGDVGFAIVLLTPDDVGGKLGHDQRPRARQNVLLELGYFIGRLGRPNVCALSTSSDMDIPTDFAGVVWERFDSSGGWKLALARELRGAGFVIDMNLVV